MNVPSYVPNDTLLMGGIEQSESDSRASPSSQLPSMLLLTGPNYSGKSVYMKQVGFLTHNHGPHSETSRLLSLSTLHKSEGMLDASGLGSAHDTNSPSFVPAESAELGVTDKILTKINTQETVSKVCRVSRRVPCARLTRVLDRKHFHE